MSAEQLLSFLHKEQKMTDMTIEDAKNFINKFELSNLNDQGFISHDG